MNQEHADQVPEGADEVVEYHTPAGEENYTKKGRLRKDFYEKVNLKPGDEPKATFVVADSEGLWAREFCNLHGLWKSS